MLVEREIDYNRKTHDLVAKVYNKSHSEIYNSIEQERIKQVVDELITHTLSGKKIRVLDFGAGTGNLSIKFLEGNCETVACDVSGKSLFQLKKKVKSNENLKTLVIEGQTLPFDSNTFDIVATYSVLHHIPDYLKSVEEMIRVCKPNGIIYIDHERNKHFWYPNEKLKEWQKLTRESLFAQFKRVLLTKEIFTFSFIKSVIIKLFVNKRFNREGDLHVWEDDHIEWEKILNLAKSLNCEIEKEQDFLLYSPKIKIDTYNYFRNTCSDTKYVILRKKSD